MIGCICSLFSIYNLLLLIGWYYIFRFLYAGYRIIEELYILKELDLAKRYGASSWALITGSTDGIGWEFAQQLAKRGFNIILTGRNAQKLDKRQAELKDKFPSVQTKKSVIDFSKVHDVSLLENLFKEFSDLDVSILVNNIGYVGAFQLTDMQRDLQDNLDLVTINCIPVTVLTKLFTEKFLSRGDSKTKSAIITISSIAGEAPTHKESYAASKVFCNYLSRGYSYVFGKEKIDFLCVKPGFVSTQMTGFKSLTRDTCTVGECVEGSLKVLGQKTETFGSKKHILLAEPQIFPYIFPLNVLRKLANEGHNDVYREQDKKKDK